MNVSILFNSFVLEISSFKRVLTCYGPRDRKRGFTVTKELQNSLVLIVELNKEITCGAVCVYPSRVADAYKTFSSFNMADKLPIAAVATGFPSGQYHLKTRLEEIRLTVADGASEIDIVINRTAALQGNWKCT